MIYRGLEISCPVCFVFCLTVFHWASFNLVFKFRYNFDSVKIIYLLSVFDLLKLIFREIDILFLDSFIYPINTHWAHMMSGIRLGALRVVRFPAGIFLWGHCFNIHQPLFLHVVSSWKYIPLCWNICIFNLYFVWITLYHGVQEVLRDSCHKQSKRTVLFLKQIALKWC